jgi:hypothetical protein
MLGIGLEAVQSARVSPIIELEVHEVSASAYPGIGDATLLVGQVGMWFHLIRVGTLRPYAQAGLGARGMVGGGGWSYGYGSNSPDRSTSEGGPTAHARLGLTSAGFRGAGLFVDAGVEAILLNPHDYALAPIRVGLTLP